MSVGKICTRTVFSTTPTEKVRRAARLMLEHNVGSLVVVELGGAPVGLLTDRDIAIRCVAEEMDPDTTSVSQIMTTPVTTVQEDTPIEEAIRKMEASQIRRLVVVDYSDRLAGLLSLDDVLELLGEESETIGRVLQTQAPV
jgi:CBS domain-containing protein